MVAAVAALAFVALCLLDIGNVDALAGVGPLFAGGVRTVRAGGRAPQTPDMPSLDDRDSNNDLLKAKKSWLSPPSTPTEARLTVVQITDVYTLENFASLRTLLKEIRACQGGNNGDVISILTGDFLAPYLLSSVDRGAGMMNCLAKTPIDYLIWGNHEADVDHRTVCRHVQNFPGTWLNTNMQNHDAMAYQKDYDVVEVQSQDKSNVRRIGLVGLLSSDPDLYSQFKEPGAFGGATVEDPWETLRKYKAILEDEEGENCDTVVPLQHFYVPDDRITCREFDVRVVLSGHDHHRVDEVCEGTRLIKPGLDGIYATVLELVWENASQEGNKPTVRSRFVKVDEWDPDPDLAAEAERAYDVLLPLRNTELARIPPTFQPLSSTNSRGKVCSMGRLICSLLKSSLNTSRRQRNNYVDAVLLMGGNIRGGRDYPEDSFFSLEALEAEIKGDEVIGIVPMPGRVLARAIEETHAGDPIPGWMQYDDGIHEEAVDDSEEHEGRTTRVTRIAGKPIDPDRTYRVATKIGDLTNEQSPTLTEYYRRFPELLPSKGSYVNIQAELMSFFARNLFRKLWEATELRMRDEDGRLKTATRPLGELCDVDECDPDGRLSTLDRDGDGVVTVDDVHVALRDFLGLSIDEEETTLAEYVHSFADTSGKGCVTVADFEVFCTEMPEVYESQKWRLAFPRVDTNALVPGNAGVDPAKSQKVPAS